MDWKLVDEKLRCLAREKGKYDLEEGRWLLAGMREAVHLRQGFGSFHEYVERLFGYGRRAISDRLMVAERLEKLPELTAALDNGELCWSAVRELVRVAIAETEKEWTEAAKGKTTRQVEELVAGHRQGDRPGSRRNEPARKHVLRFEVSGEVKALFREAIARVRRDAGESLSDDEALGVIARQVLGGPTDEGRASYQIAINKCPECGEAHQQGAGELLRVDPAVLEAAECDCQEIDLAHTGEAKPATQRVPPTTRRLVVKRDHGRCTVPGCRAATFLDIHHIKPQAEGVDHRPENLTLVCSAHHGRVHDGYLIIEGRAPDGLTFRHADGTTYASVAFSAGESEKISDAFQALKQVGFKEGQARRGIDAAVAHVGSEGDRGQRSLRVCSVELRVCSVERRPIVGSLWLVACF